MLNLFMDSTDESTNHNKAHHLVLLNGDPSSLRSSG